MKKIVMTALLALCLAPAASFAQIVVRVRPPEPIHEHYGPPPHEGYVWVSGYHNWDGNRYVWVPGRWDRRHIHTHDGKVTTGFAAMADGC